MRNGHVVGRSAVLLWLAFLLLLLLPSGMARAQPAPADPTPEQVRSLLQLLADPAVQAWIARRAEEAATPPPEAAAPVEEVQPVATVIEGRLQRVRQNLAEIASAVPRLPAELAAAGDRVTGELAGHGLGRVALLLVVFVGLGFAVERLFARATAGLDARADAAAASPADVPARLRAIGTRFLLDLARVLSFALGSVGGFLLFSWPPQLRRLVVGYLAAVLVLRVGLAVCRFLFAPARAHLRVVPMGDAAAAFWTRWTTALVAWFAFGWVTIELLRRLGLGVPAVRLVAYALGIALLAIALRMIWRPTDDTARGLRVALSAWAVAIWVAWVAADARPLMWALIVAGLLPVAIRGAHRAVEHMFRPATAEEGARAAPLPAAAVIFERAVRFLLIVAGVWVLVWGWDLDFGTLTNQDDPLSRFARGAVHAVVILLVADLLWKLASTAIDRQLALTGPVGVHGEEELATTLSPEEERRRARVRTLLPILRTVLLAVLAVMAVLMALSALGVQIGPLIAGAGVIGVAIGFGSQTLVHDVISGMFYLLDDAFRVGEYIVSGTFRGTVEGFSLRSVKLRHHRGPLFTVPFSSLGAVQNLSRDWVIDKLTFNVPFDTDVAQVKKVVKQVSKEIMEDPDLAKGILEPLKSQGVAMMNDFAMQVRVKFKAKPGGQFAVRRAAYDRIKKAFAANGIKIAVPTVNVASGEGQGEAAAAQQAMELARKPAAAE
jgi:moderate conductance mechanosensitive channel